MFPDAFLPNLAIFVVAQVTAWVYLRTGLIATGVSIVVASWLAADVALVAAGSMVQEAWLAAKSLFERGTRAMVVNARFLKPLDTETLLSVAKSVGRIVTVEENVRTGGFGQQVRDVLCSNGHSSVKHEIIALGDGFVEHGAQPIIRAENGLCADNIANVAAALVAAGASRLA